MVGWVSCMGLSQLHKALNNITDIQKSLADQQRLQTEHQCHREPQIHEICCDVAYLGHCSFGEPQEHLGTPNCKGHPGPHWTRGVPAGPPEADGPGVLTPKKGWRISSPTRTEGTCTTRSSSMQGLSDELAEQMWMVLQSLLVVVSRDPTCWSQLSGSSKRKKNWLMCIWPKEKKKKQTSLASPERPRIARRKCLPSWMEPRLLELRPDRQTPGSPTRCGLSATWKSQRSMSWMSHHCQKPDGWVFSSSLWNFRNHLNMYHHALRKWMQEFESEDLEANEIMSLWLTWVSNTYTSTEMTGNVELAQKWISTPQNLYFL